MKMDYEYEGLKKPAVTKDWLLKKLEVTNDRAKVIGRALLAIYKNQTLQEQENTSTRFKNGIGFCKPDARVGSIGARMYHSKATLDQWVIDVWMRPSKDGMPRICKYANQLNDISSIKYQMLIDKSKSVNILKNVILL